MAHTNVPEVDAVMFHLVKNGYGSLREVEAFDIETVLNILEFEAIQNEITQCLAQSQN